MNLNPSTSGIKAPLLVIRRNESNAILRESSLHGSMLVSCFIAPREFLAVPVNQIESVELQGRVIAFFLALENRPEEIVDSSQVCSI